MVKIKSDFEQQKKDNKLSGKQKLSKFYNTWIKNMSSIRQILLWYLIISITGALLLWAPFTHKDANTSVSFIDALFTSSSAFSDTGLTTVSISEKFNFLGQLVTLILLSIGGVGWFTIKIFILQFILRKNTSYTVISDAANEVGTKRKKETLGLIFSAVVISTSATIIFGLIFMFIFATTPAMNLLGEDVAQLQGNWFDSLWTGIYHASASVNNSGLDIFNSDASLGVYYAGANGIAIQVLTIMLFVLGGVGFGVFYDLFQWIKFRAAGKRFSLSLITKISVVTYAIVSMVGLLLSYGSEGISYAVDQDNSFIGGLINNGSTEAAAWWSITFNTFSTRNAGFSTADIANLSESTKLLFSIMMFIGSGPGSTAGGLRTTALAVLMVAVWSDMRGKNSYSVMNRNIPRDVVRNAFTILVASLALVSGAIIIVTSAEALSGKEVNLIDIIFNVFSAYGTTGLSTTPLADYHEVSKVAIILLMFLGQMGMNTTLSQFRAKKHKTQKDFVEENINLG